MLWSLRFMVQFIIPAAVKDFIYDWHEKPIPIIFLETSKEFFVFDLAWGFSSNLLVYTSNIETHSPRHNNVLSIFPNTAMQNFDCLNGLMIDCVFGGRSRDC